MFFLQKLFRNSPKKRIEFISNVVGLSEVVPPYPARKNFPSWFNQISSSIDPHNSQLINDKRYSTVKRCPGIVDYISAGYVLPLWTDLIVRYDSGKGELACEASAPWTNIQVHQSKQFDNTSLKSLIEPYKNIIKLESPWRVKLPKGFSSLMVEPFYYDSSLVFTVIPGVVDHDSFFVANVFIKWNLYGKGEYYLKKGTPLCKIIPFQRIDLHSEIRDATEQDRYLEQVESIKLDSFEGTYRKLFWSRKKYI